MEEFIESLSLDTADDFPRALREALLNPPYSVKTTWKGDLIILNAHPKQTNFELYPVLRECNGLVIDAQTRNVVCYSYNLLQEANEDTAETVNKGITNGDYLIEELHDGCVIRAFYYQNEWHTSTLKCVDARDAFFSDRKSFHEMFEEAMAQMGLTFDQLNVNYCYTFLLFHPANHMVVPYDTPSLIHISTYDTLERRFRMDSTLDRVPKPKTRQFLSYTEMWNFLTTQTFVLPVSPTSGTLGYILTLRDDPSAKLKVEAPAYIEARRSKGNHPNIKCRLIEIMQQDNFFRNGRAQQNFLRYYPQYQNDLNYLMTRFRNYLNSVYTLYNEVYRQGPSGAQNRYIPEQLDRHIVDELYLIYIEEGRLDIPRVCRLFGTYSLQRMMNILGVKYLIRKRQVGNRFNENPTMTSS